MYFYESSAVYISIIHGACTGLSSITLIYNKHFGINTEYFSELVQNIFHFHFTKKDNQSLLL